MSYYVIGIGGSGAKCAEAFTHLCAMGMLPAQDVYCIFVDPDRANGSLGRASVTLTRYQDCHALQVGDREKVKMFRANISVGNPYVWSPFMEDQQRPKLADFFEYPRLKAKDIRAAQLFDVLYSETEKGTSLEMGFRGHPSIGAAIMARTVKLDEAEPWQTFRKLIGNDASGGEEARIFLVGSIFGGTGASGFPTITRLIRNELKTSEVKYAKIGGALLLPYFNFSPDKKVEMRANSEYFLMNTQMALEYYYNREKLPDIIYLLGEENYSTVRFSLGSTEQKNEANFIELYAALAAVDFFTQKEPKGYAMVARQDKGRIDWLDLPDGKKGSNIKPLFSQLTRFAFAYLHFFYPAWKSVREGGKSFRFPFYKEYFEKIKNQVNQAEVDKKMAQVKEYCEFFLLWVAQIATSAKTVNVELINYLPFAKIESTPNEGSFAQLLPNFRENEFNKLVYPIGPDGPKEIATVLDNLHDRNVSDTQADGLGKFFHALYKAYE
jgi:hypothetical protein